MEFIYHFIKGCFLSLTFVLYGDHKQKFLPCGIVNVKFIIWIKYEMKQIKQRVPVILKLTWIKEMSNRNVVKQPSLQENLKKIGTLKQKI